MVRKKKHPQDRYQRLQLKKDKFEKRKESEREARLLRKLQREREKEQETQDEVREWRTS